MKPTSAPDGNRERAVSNVDIIKALADPLRLSLLHELMKEAGATQPTMSVKELAAALGEPQTKLYRHIKHLESAGLIRAVTSRVVSGIIEQRYQACQSDLTIGQGFTDREKTSPEAEAMAAAALELYRRQYFGARRAYASRASQPDPPDYRHEPHRWPILGTADGRVPVAKAAAIRAQLQQILDDLTAAGNHRNAAGTGAENEETVQVNVLIGYFSSGSDLGQN